MATIKRKYKHKSIFSFIPLISVVFLPFMILVICRMQDNKAAAFAREIRGLEQKLAANKQKLIRENAAWNQLCKIENLDGAIRRNGLKLELPRPEQIYRIKKDGRIIADVRPPANQQPPRGNARKNTETYTARR